MGDAESFEVEVAYARPDAQMIVPVRVQPGATVEDAIRRSGVLEKFMEIDLGTQRIGIFSKLVELQHPLCPGDRVEIYRHLIADPKEARKKRARQVRARRA
jgi:putative ubiquitin-RnfH superfamily antitoxin RatB of RatAB toxin-antitoxin module